MFRIMLAAVTTCAALVAVSARADIIAFNFNLDAEQEVPRNDSDAVGSARLLYDTETQHFSIDLMVFGIGLDDLMGAGGNSTPVHIHNAPAGFNGPIVVDLGFMAEFQEDGLGIRLQITDELFGGQQGNVFSDPDDNEARLFAGRLYVNIHTKSFPGGEIRGQIPAIPAPASAALLAGAGFAGLTARRRRSRS